MISKVVFYNSVLVILVHGFIYSNQIFQYRTSKIIVGCKNNDKSENDLGKKIKKAQNKFDRSIDDFMGKRYGKGEVFYGKRTSDMSEEEYRVYIGGETSAEVPYSEKPMRGNAILIVGGLDSIGQWVAFDLAEKGFTIRVTSEDNKEAIEWFGLPGNNVDIIPLTPDSSEENYAKAIEGIQAIILAGNFDPTINVGPLLDKGSRYGKIVKRLLSMTVRAQQAEVGEVQKIVQISRYTPWADAKGEWGQGLTQQQPKKNDFISSLFSAANGAVDAPFYSQFRKQHENVEEDVRRCGLNYGIIRAPPIVALTRAGARYRMTLIQKPSDLNELSTTTEESGSTLSLTLGQLDLAEAAVQTLLSEQLSKTTFTVCEDPNDLISRRRRAAARRSKLTGTTTAESEKRRGLFDYLFGDEEREEDLATVAEEGQEEVLDENQDIIPRPSRNSYYGILTMSDEDLRASYMIRAEEAVIQQLTEDEMVEQYWSRLFKTLQRDSK